jgi:hypothetical protein
MLDKLDVPKAVEFLPMLQAQTFKNITVPVGTTLLS